MLYQVYTIELTHVRKCTYMYTHVHTYTCALTLKCALIYITELSINTQKETVSTKSTKKESHK